MPAPGVPVVSGPQGDRGGGECTTDGLGHRHGERVDVRLLVQAMAEPSPSGWNERYGVPGLRGPSPTEGLAGRTGLSEDDGLADLDGRALVVDRDLVSVTDAVDTACELGGCSCGIRSRGLGSVA